MNLFLVKPGAEPFLTSECKLHTIDLTIEAPGILSTKQPVPNSALFCFPYWVVRNYTVLGTAHETRPIDTVCNWFCDEIRNERIDKSWHLFWLVGSENGFTPVTSKQDHLKDALKKRISRISKLADSSFPAADTHSKGLFIVEDVKSGVLFVATEASFCGQRRMKDDPVAPSRSYLKVEEAFTIFGYAPVPRSTVADLGAAPGGWTWAALKRGAIVFAIDNGPLKKGPLDHPDVHHLSTDAFSWKPEFPPVDWLFCDMVQKPQPVFERVRTWFSQGWCRNAIINFKFGYSDPGEILKQLYSPKGLQPFTDTMLCRHLFHDRDEITLMAKIRIR